MIINPNNIKMVNSEVANLLPAGWQILMLKESDEGYALVSKTSHSHPWKDRSGCEQELARFDKATGEKLMALNQQGQELREQERREAKCRHQAQEQARVEAEEAGLCPECGGEVTTQVIEEVAPDPQAHPVKQPTEYYGGKKYQKNCPCGEQFFAWNQRKE